MIADGDAKLIRAAARKLYGNGQKIWDPDDRWNQVKCRRIRDFGARHAARWLDRSDLALDLGCGRDGYDWIPPHCIGVDRFLSQVADHPNAVVADIEALPFRSGCADFVICVGAALNYVSAAEAISEMARVVRVGGRLLLHFETSTSFEHFGTGRWGGPVVRIDTENSGRPDTIWVYRPEYIDELVVSFGFAIRHKQHFHIASALGLRLGLKQLAAARLARLDPLLSWLGRLGDDVILLAEKVAEADGAGAESGRRRLAPRA